MKSNKEYVDEDTIKNINDLLEKSKIENFIIDDKDIDIDQILNMDESSLSQEQSSPGSLKFRMDGFKMSLFMDLKAPINSDNEITLEDIKIQIEKLGSFCEEQTKWELIRDIYSRVIFDGEIVPEIIVAKGKDVKFNIPEHILLKDNLSIDQKPEVLDSKSVDFHHIKSFLVVSQNEHLGNIIINEPGEDGLDLYGHPIPSPKKYVNYLSKGENVYSNNGKVYSEIEGAFKILNNKITVDPVLSIQKDVDYSTGDIKFNGDVNITQSIREGFTVKAGRDMYVGESIEPANISCGNSLYAKQGIIGSDKYTINCTNSLHALHIENAHIKCNGTISIKNCIINSKIYCLDNISMDEASSIIGGIYHIQNGIHTGHIGNKSGVKTYIKLGVDYKVEDKLKILRDTIGLLDDEIDYVQEKVHHANTKEEKYKLRFLFLSLKNRQHSLISYTRSLLSRLDKNDNCKLRINGTVYPGTHIDICHVKYIVSKQLHGVEFYLNKAEGEIEYSYVI